MSKYEIKFTRAFKKSHKKLNQAHKDLLMFIINILANDEVLEPKYNDHALKGEWINHRECHIYALICYLFIKSKMICLSLLV